MMTKKYVLGALPNAEQDELLTVLIEEASEIIKAATKIQRFGAIAGAYHNSLDLAKEIGELNWIAHMVVDTGLILATDIQLGYDGKRMNVRDYLVHS